MRIRLKISLGCLGIASLVAVVGWLSAVTHDEVRNDVEAFRESSLLEFIGATQMLVALKATHAAAQELVVEGWHAHFDQRPDVQGGGDFNRATAAIDDRLAAFADGLATSRQATESAISRGERRSDTTAIAGETEEMAWLDGLAVELVVHRTRLDALVALAQTDLSAAGHLLEEHVEPHYREVMLPLIQRYKADAQTEFDAVVEGVGTALARSDRRNQLAVATAGVLAVMVGFFLTRSISRPIRMLADAAQRIGSGDLDARVNAGSRDEVGMLADSFNRMAERLQQTMVSKGYMDDIFRSMGEILLVSDSADRIRSVNRAAQEQLGWSEHELVGRDVHEIVRSAEEAGELRIITRDGTVLPVACAPTDLNDDLGQLRGRVWVAQNILHQKTIEQQLRRSVEEKDVLLREIHHRVKNNLQVICSLLQLQAADAAPEVVRRLAESERRVRTMALIHEQLYRSGDLAHIDFRAYVETLAKNVLSSTGGTSRPVALRVDVEPSPLDLDVAILCGLILNELVSNSMKHAFPESRPGEISVCFRRHQGRAILMVADDGVGLESAAAGQAAPSLGLRLVRAFARQLGAETTMDGSAGTTVTVAFDIPGTEEARGIVTGQA